MTSIGAPAPDDIFTDGQRWGDLDEWNRAALALHDIGGIHLIERDGFRPFWAVIDHPATMKTTFVGGHKSLPIRYELTKEG